MIVFQCWMFTFAIIQRVNSMWWLHLVELNSFNFVVVVYSIVIEMDLLLKIILIMKSAIETFWFWTLCVLNYFSSTKITNDIFCKNIYILCPHGNWKCTMVNCEFCSIYLFIFIFLEKIKADFLCFRFWFIEFFMWKMKMWKECMKIRWRSLCKLMLRQIEKIKLNIGQTNETICWEHFFFSIFPNFKIKNAKIFVSKME